MRNLLRGLTLALVLVSALTVPSAKAVTGPPALEACVDGTGSCSETGAPCATRAQCGPNEICICP
jgi:hypothetical protein